MAKLSKEEQRMLRRLQEKSEAPDAPPIGKTVNVAVDLGDKNQVAMAQRLGLFDGLAAEEEEETEEEESEEEADETPKRRGYFPD